MQGNPQQFLAAKTLLALALAAGPLAARAGGIPVIDAGNLQHNMLTAMESVTQTLKQVEQYKTQLLQYENMLQNTAAPTAYIWDQAESTMGQLRQAMDTLQHYKQQAGGIEAYLDKFQDLDYYRSSPCLKGGCSAARWSQMTEESAQRGTQVQKQANDALFRGLDRQQAAMQSDARQLQKLQSAAQGATGQMQALAAANQLASHQAMQLQQIRALLIAQQTAVATRQQVLADREARQQAAHEAATAPRIGLTPNPLNWLSIKH
ncbi:P-type conjugative transfer protein TrbJ [Acidovorax sp. Be4]|uniref:P-type conjugative transfer protein TrbJ n=1 Tax=Acidovorax bellezanensis TaxID=2976702 RepID=A0ABT2PKT4_9BURK|nr:P-type conjugative transfer protein TrbJ [Acidovorax sp. Be4]MCT9811089.1 P-type conjugative transfer protein TrbJ [Acidovorax sp. Be4]